MEFLDLVNNTFTVNLLDIYLFITVLMGTLMMVLFFLFSEESILATLYVSSFTILHILGLIARQILIG